MTLQHAAAMSEAVGHALILVYKDQDYEGKPKLACAWAGNPDLKLPKIYLYNSTVIDGKFKNRLLIGTWFLLGSGDSSGEGRDAAATTRLAPHQKHTTRLAKPSSSTSTQRYQTPLAPSRPPYSSTSTQLYQTPLAPSRPPYSLARVDESIEERPLTIDKSKLPEGEQEISLDAWGRPMARLFTVTDDSVVSSWCDDIAALIAETCPKDLESRECKGICPLKHICRGFSKSHEGVTCEISDHEHDGLVHVLPTCRRALAHGKCNWKEDECGFGHDHMEVRRARKVVLKEAMEVSVEQLRFPRAVKHVIEYI